MTTKTIYPEIKLETKDEYTQYSTYVRVLRNEKYYLYPIMMEFPKGADTFDMMQHYGSKVYQIIYNLSDNVEDKFLDENQESEGKRVFDLNNKNYGKENKD